MYEQKSRPNNIIIYVSGHGYDGIIYDPADPRVTTQSMFPYTSDRILRKQQLEGEDASLCKLYIAEAVGISGTCSIFGQINNDATDRSEQETTIITAYNEFNKPGEINDLNASNHYKYRKLLQKLKKLYYELNMQEAHLSRLPPEIAYTLDENKALYLTAGLYNSFIPNPDQRDKLFQLGPNQDEIDSKEEAGEHYGLHILNIHHQYLPSNYKINDNPFPSGFFNGRNWQQAHSNSPYIMNNYDNQYIFRNILEERKRLGKIREDDYTDASAFLYKLLLIPRSPYPRIKLSQLWVLFDILGFDEVYIIDTSCRELVKTTQSQLKSGKKHGSFYDESINIGLQPGIDPLEWTPDVPIEDETTTRGRQQQYHAIRENMGLAPSRKAGGKRTKRRRNRKPKKSKRRKTRRN